MHRIFSHFISKDSVNDERRVAYLNWFCETFPVTEFSGDDRIMREYAAYSNRLGVPFKDKYLSTFMSTELRQLLISENIKIIGTETLNYSEPSALETAVQVCTESILGKYRELELEEIDIDDFKISADTYMTNKLNERLTETLSKTFEIVSETDNSVNAAEFALEAISYLQDIYDKEQLEELVESNTSDSTIRFICDTGIPAIDNDIDGIYETHVAGIEAQPGTGKTRFALGVWVYRAATIYKENCLFFQLEQSKAEMEAILIARHVFFLYNIQIDAGWIIKNKVPEEIKDKVASAKLDLFESGKYGKIEIVETTLYLESFIEKIKTIDKLKGPFKLIAIDYMGLIEQTPYNSRNKGYIPRLDDYQIIGRSFKKFKRYIRKTRKGGVAISQFNDKGIEAGKADKEITTNMAQGGIEVYRNTDFNLALSMTAEMKLQQKRRVSQPKVRNSLGFGNFILDTRLGFAYFYQSASPGKV